jgi:hypothetical protein
MLTFPRTHGAKRHGAAGFTGSLLCDAGMALATCGSLALLQLRQRSVAIAA